MSADRYTEWDGAYVLGALSSGERLEFEAHLEQCDDCAGRVGELAGMPGVLARLDRPSA
ncbi:MAG TPA: zf-HC2 domain-containing protein, partial [Amnibacterium sp.]|nr:zf-HC2 domain-containing protein [Amnibacterium sp.]